jgi:hypothetical protein
VIPPASPEFVAMLERWHDVFLLTGTAAVTLIGLLFVSLSFNLDVILHESRAHLIALARQSFFGFIYVMIVSVFCLEPVWRPRPLGVSLITLGALLFVFWLRHLFDMRKGDHSELGTRTILLRASFGLISALLLAGGGWGIVQGAPEALHMVTLALMFLLATGARSAWDLLVRVGKARERLGIHR